MGGDELTGDGAVYRWADATSSPWRNGGGVTRELVSSPAGGDDFDWRISVADVATSGEFSVFPGVHRTIVLVDGPEMTLTIGGVGRRLRRYEPVEFDGGEHVRCAVPAGPTRDLNVMTRAGRCRATVAVLTPDPSAVAGLPGRQLQLVMPLAGSVVVEDTAGRRLSLGRFDLLRLPPAAGVTLTGDGPVAVIEIVREP